MKKFMIVMAILVNVLNFSFAQVDSIDNKNLYIRAIRAMIDSIPKEYGNITPNKNLKKYIIQRNEEIIKNLPTQIKDINISYLTIDELKELTIKMNSKIPIVVLRPIKNDNNLIKISFTNYWLDYGRFRKKTGKKTLNFALEGGHDVYFKYDCSINDFVIFRIDNWGI
jgi:hypothetical protein